MISTIKIHYTFTKTATLLTLTLALAGCTTPGQKSSVGDGAGGYLGGSATPGSTQDFAQNVGDRIFFETDSSDLTAKAITTLDKQAQWLQQYTKISVIVEGHADERGTREYNFALSARRAHVVKDYLASRGVPSQRLKVVSYGKERPIAVCNDISCWSQNRRAVTVVGAQVSDMGHQSSATTKPWDNN